MCHWRKFEASLIYQVKERTIGTSSKVQDRVVGVFNMRTGFVST